MIVIKFSMKNCAPCKAYQPVWDSIVESYKDRPDISFREHDSLEEIEFQNNMGVDKYPTTLVVTTQKYEGAMKLEDLREILG